MGKFIYCYYQIMYWGTAKWSPVEIFETFSMARTLHCIAPLCEYAEYHPFHREKVREAVKIENMTMSCNVGEEKSNHFKLVY